MVTLSALTRIEIEDFLIDEASLLDEWRLEDWRRLFTSDCSYLVPNMGGDPYASPDSTLFLIADDGHHLTERVKRLGKRTAHAEYPHSTTLHLISNVRLMGYEDGHLRVRCGFTTYRTNHGLTDTYFGHHEYLFVQPEDRLLIQEKRTILAIGALRPHGKLSIIV